MNIFFSYILDIISGKFVEGIKLILLCLDGSILIGIIDSDGWFKDWGILFEVGIYILCFYCYEYFIFIYGKSFYFYIDICFELGDEGGYYYVFLFILFFGFSSYRGS